jgi:hypothetical protein
MVQGGLGRKSQDHHELTPLCSPSLLRKEGEINYDSVLYTPSLRSREGVGGEFILS